MGAAYSHTCNECGHVVRTSGPWEFYRDKEGKRKPYGHPAPTSREAAEAGIYGLSAELYCPECGKTYDIIIRKKAQCGARAAAEAILFSAPSKTRI